MVTEIYRVGWVPAEAAFRHNCIDLRRRTAWRLVQMVFKVSEGGFSSAGANTSPSKRPTLLSVDRQSVPHHKSSTPHSSSCNTEAC